MKKQKKLQIIVILLVTTIIFLANSKVLASTTDFLQKVEYSKEFQEWLELSEEERKKVMQPRMYEIPYMDVISTSPFYKMRMLGASLQTKYSLKDIIPNNVSIRNQQTTNSCWAFATLSSLETNLALSNYKKGMNTEKVYDFSERHMEYATSKTFANNVKNENGYNREVNTGGNWYMAESYLTNGSGAIEEEEMPFENNGNVIDISEIQNKTVTSQVCDTIEFPDYRMQAEEQKLEIMNRIKQHIQNYGSVYTCIHGNSSSVTAFECYNNDTGAKFCNSSFLHKPDHAVSIIGWDDNYSVDNFPENAKPEANGAWIIRNSWGERQEYKLSELKEEIFNANKQACIQNGWNSATEIPNDLILRNGYTIENDIAYMKIGDNGIIYVSYEDRNISTSLTGIIKATDNINYDNIYQYDTFYPATSLRINGTSAMLCNIFDKKTSATEYLTQVSLYAPETYTCKVYVNPNGTSKAKKDMQLVPLKVGTSETINAGYHTLEFADPIELKADNFAVIIEIQGNTASNRKISLESKVNNIDMWDSVTVEKGKCFIATGDNLENCEWIDLGNLSQENASFPDCDSTIKAFTVSEVLDNSLKSIEITTPPTKTTYFEGEDFEKEGMVVKANYNDNVTQILEPSSYTIKNGTNLKAGQTNVTITYEDKSVNQNITVEKNDVIKLEITTPPNKVEYKEGQNFDKTGMVLEATYKDGTKKIISDYRIENGNNLKENQTDVIISYGEKTVQQPITVISNPLIEIQITKEPDKTSYIVGQNFDKTGMIVSGIYQDGEAQEILDYTIENGTKLTKDQTSVTVEYEGKTVIQPITVEEKTITGIAIHKKPAKLSYIQNKEELDLTEGSIKITYHDGSTENIDMMSDEITVTGFNNKKLGKNIITITYQNKTAEFEIEIIEEEKAENSNLEQITNKVKKIQLYLYDDNSEEKDYALMSIEINNIAKSLNNDSFEYYYYLSANEKEKNINRLG